MTDTNLILVWSILALIATANAILSLRATKLPSWHLLYLIPLITWGIALIYFAYLSVLGYPTSDYKKPLNAQLLAYWVPTTEKEGEDLIAVWVHFPNDTKPRAINIVYTKTAHEQLQAAMERVNSGVPQRIIDNGEQLIEENGESLSATMNGMDSGTEKSAGGEGSSGGIQIVPMMNQNNPGDNNQNQKW